MDQKKKKGGSSSNKASCDALFGGSAGNSGGSKQSSTSHPVAVPSSKGYQYGGNKNKSPMSTGLKGKAKDAKMKEAEEYRNKANKCMPK